MPELDSIGKRIHHIRIERGFTLEILADRSHLSKSFIWEVEHDRSGISGKRLLQVANAMGASVDFLLRGEPVLPDYEPPSIEIPRSLSDLAQELGLTFRQTMMLLDIDRSIVARRSTKTEGTKNKDEWLALYHAVREYLEEPK